MASVIPQAAAGIVGLMAGKALGSTKPKPVPASVTAAQDRAEARAEAQTREEMAQMAARRRVRRTGGLRLLMSPQRQEGQQTAMRTTLGPGG